MTAAEAARTSDEVSGVEKQVQYCIALVKDAVARGKREVEIPDGIGVYAGIRLKDLGYRVSNGSAFSTHSIRW